MSPLEAAVGESKLFRKIADKHEDTHPLPISRLLSVSLNFQKNLTSMGTFVHFTSREAAVS